jgi:chromate reductase, NAD(P)H dehydrogenase (quinone)
MASARAEVESYRVFGIAGSLRRGSFNRSLLRSAEELAPANVVFDTFEGLGGIPPFSPDLEGGLTPAAVVDLRDRIVRADAVLVATPEYNSSMPGVLKNALDWASRPAGESVLAGKPAAVFGASPGRYGAVWAQADARKVLTAIGANVLDAEFPVARVQEKFDERRNLVDQPVRDELRALVSSLLDLVVEPAPAELAESAAYSLECQRLAAQSA